MSLKERLQKNKANKQIVLEENLPKTIKEEIPLKVDESVKKSLILDLSIKILKTPIWHTLSETEQKNLIIKFVEHQINTTYHDNFVTTLQKQFFVRDVIDFYLAQNKLDFYIQEPEINAIYMFGFKNFIVERCGKLEKISDVFSDITDFYIAICKLKSLAISIVDNENNVKIKLSNFDEMFYSDIENQQGLVFKYKKHFTNEQVNNFAKKEIFSDKNLTFLSDKIKADKKILSISSSDFHQEILMRTLFNKVDTNEINFYTDEFKKERLIKSDKLFVNNLSDDTYIQIFNELLMFNGGAIIGCQAVSFDAMLQKIIISQKSAGVDFSLEEIKNIITSVFNYIVEIDKNGISKIISIEKNSKETNFDEIYNKKTVTKKVKISKNTKK